MTLSRRVFFGQAATFPEGAVPQCRLCRAVDRSVGPTQIRRAALS
jgi:hypothetical protein